MDRVVVLDRVHAELAGLLRGFDPGRVACADAADLWARADRIERQAAALKLLLAARVEESGAWKTAGYRSAPEALAVLAGTSVTAARGVLETSRRLSELPALDDALRAGELSAVKAAAVADAAAVAPDRAGELVAVASGSTYAETRDACLRAKAAADPDRDATFARIQRGRRLVEWVDGEGAWNLRARGTVVDGARVRSVLEQLADRRARDARARGEREPRDAYAFDALVTLARDHTEPADDDTPGATRRTVPVRWLTLVRVDWETLRHAEAHGDDMCEITGLGPIPAAAARALLGESVLKLVITKGVDVLHVTHLGRGPSAAQRIALAWTSPICTAEGCTRTRLEIDHRRPWAETHHTRLDELDGLCDHDHWLKTHEGWALVQGTGRRPLVPPDDPRHPRNHPPPDT